MGVLEAMTAHVPSVVTSWGGFKDFSFSDEILKKIEVTINQEGIVLNEEEFKQALLSIYKNKKTNCDGLFMSQIEDYTIENTGVKLSDILNASPTKFEGFSDRSNCFIDLDKNEHSFEYVYELLNKMV